MPLVFGLLSLCALVFGATLAQLGVIAPLMGLLISLASLPLSLFSVIASFIRAYQSSSLAAVFASFPAWVAPVVFAPPAYNVVREHAHLQAIDTRPIRTTQPIDVAFQTAIDEIDEHDDWRVLKSDRKRHTLEAQAMSRVFQFRHVFAIQMRRSDGQTVVEMKSLSPPVRYDLGAQKREVADFLKALDARLSTTEIRL